MKARIVGGGWYGTHLATVLLNLGYDVTLFEANDRLFSGASGNMPARAHRGFHYPRSKLTRTACRAHLVDFERIYGHLTHAVPINIYAVAEHDSLMDWGTYRQIMEAEEQVICINKPNELGLHNVEGAMLTSERHVLLDEARSYFEKLLGNKVVYGERVQIIDDPAWDVTLDCSFCALENRGIDRYETCVTLLLEGPTDRAVTIMDGKLPSLYPWDEDQGLSSLTSAKWTVLDRCNTWAEARASLDSENEESLRRNAVSMFDQMAFFYPRVRDEYRIVDHRLAIRAMPRSAADARLVDVVRVGERAVRIRAGKLDAIFHAERVIRDMLPEFDV